MNHWQDIVVAVLIAGAAIYLARLLWSRLTRRGNASCTACLGCPSSSCSTDEKDGSRSTDENDGPVPPSIHHSSFPSNV